MLILIIYGQGGPEPPVLTSVGTPKGVELELTKNVYDCNVPISTSIAAKLVSITATTNSNAATCPCKAMILRAVMSDFTGKRSV